MRADCVNQPRTLPYARVKPALYTTHTAPLRGGTPRRQSVSLFKCEKSTIWRARAAPRAGTNVWDVVC